MNCFSMLKKFIGDKFFNHDPILPLNKVPEPEVTELKKLQKPEPKPLSKKPATKLDEDDDLFKEMEPQYVAARRIGATVLVSNKPKKSARFEMEADVTNSWEVEDFT
jgi:hypothetical protein